MASEPVLTLAEGLAKVIGDQLQKIPAGTRLEVFQALNSRFCFACGTDDLPCHCTRDE